MTAPVPTIRVPVDPANPGQFFACCGLLELAHCLDRDRCVQGWFQEDHFALAGGVTDLLDRFRKSMFEQIDLSQTELRYRNGKVPKIPEQVNPVKITPAGGDSLTLDWWLRPSVHNGLKIWSGSNSVRALVEDVFEVIRNDNSDNILQKDIQLERQPFFFAATRAIHEREFGVSLDKIDRDFVHYPYVELLAMIGLQRCRPIPLDGGRFQYCSWSLPISAELAGPVVAGLVESLIHECFTFAVVERDDHHHKQFMPSERRRPHA
jgi:CRISPR-associated protein Csx14